MIQPLWWCVRCLSTPPLLPACALRRQHTFLNKAIGGTTSGIFATCAEKLVPPETDLVVVEFTFNEPGDQPFIFPHRRGFEQLLRKLARLPRAPAVIVLHHYAWYFSDGDGLKAGLFYRAAEMQLSSMAQVRRAHANEHITQLGRQELCI